MNKNKVKTILKISIVIIALILCLNVAVYAAYALSATEVSYTKSSGSTVNVKEALDELYTKVPIHEIGDIVTVGGEKFYVLEWDNNSNFASLFAYYAIDTKGSTQTVQWPGMKFCSSSYWGKYYMGNHMNIEGQAGMSENDVIWLAQKYAREKSAIDGRLLTYDEANWMKLNSNVSSINNMLIGFGGNQSHSGYWLSTTQVGTSQQVLRVSNSGSIGPANFSDSTLGCRPVIYIEKSKITE